MSAPGKELMKLGQRSLSASNSSRIIRLEMLKIFLHNSSAGISAGASFCNFEIKMQVKRNKK